MVSCQRSNLLKFFLCLGLFLLPLIFWPWALVPYEIPRVWFVQGWVTVWGVIAILSGIWGLRKKVIDRQLLVLVVAFTLIALVSSYFGIDFNKSLGGNFYRRDGLFTLFPLVGFSLCLFVFWEKSWRQAVSLSIALGSFLASAWNLALGYRFHLRGDLDVNHFGQALGGTFGQPNFLAGYLLVTLPFTLWKLAESEKKAKLFWFLVLASQLLALILTLSRAAYVGAIFVLFGWLVLRRTKGSRWGKKIVALTAALMILVFAGIAFLPRQTEIRPDLVEQRTRERILVKGLKAFTHRPLLGWGWANFDYAFEATDWPKKLTIDVYVDKAHSSFLEILVTLGVGGFLVYVMMLKRIFQKLYFSGNTDWWRQALFLVFLVLIFHSQTNIVSIGEEVVFWLILGIVGAEA